VAEGYVPPKHLREVRALIRHRASMVRIRTMVKNALIDRWVRACIFRPRKERDEMAQDTGAQPLG